VVTENTSIKRKTENSSRLITSQHNEICSNVKRKHYNSVQIADILNVFLDTHLNSM